MGFGKIIGIVFGIMMGARLGVIGSALGAMFGGYIGALFDLGMRNISRHNSYARLNPEASAVFFQSMFTLMGYLAKFDGRVSEQEIQVARIVMARMGLGEEQKQAAVECFRQGKAEGFNWQAQLDQLLSYCTPRSDIMQSFLEILIELAHAEGPLNQNTISLLLSISERLGFNQYEFERLIVMYHAQNNFRQHRDNWQYKSQSNYQHGQQGHYRSNSGQTLRAAYDVLGVKADATDADVKKAYRKLMSQHHPDKLASKGLPPEMMKMATEKTQQIKAAYDQVISSRKEAA